MSSAVGNDSFAGTPRVKLIVSMCESVFYQGRHVRRGRLQAAHWGLPVNRPVVLQELAPHVRAGIESTDDRIDDPRRAVDDVERRMEALFLRFPRRDVDRVLVS